MNHEQTTVVSPKSEVSTLSLKLERDGTIACGSKRYKAEEDTIRKEILRLMAKNPDGHLLREDFKQSLIESHFKWRANGAALINETYMRRQNNVEKAISRLRKDLGRFFGEHLPEGTSWMCFSKKIDGWLLYRLPGLGCDGNYHW